MALDLFGTGVRALSLARSLLDLLWLLVSIRLKSMSVRLRPWTAVDEFEERVAMTPEALALLSTARRDESLTFRGLSELSNQVAHWLRGCGVRTGDVVVVAHHGCPAYVALWLGVAKAGGTAALVNTQLRGKPLLHALRVALEGTPPARRVIICDAEALDEMQRAAAGDQGAPALAQVIAVSNPAGVGQVPAATDPAGCRTSAPAPAHAPEPPAGTVALAAALDAQPRFSVDDSAREGVIWSSPLCLIYTSGTTGLPKASRFNHLRFWMAGRTMQVLCRLRASDRIYCALPLYHASGGMLGVGGALLSGCTLLVPPKFSARHFCKDCAVHGATVVQYIGEMARFVVAACPGGAAGEPAVPGLQVRVAIGNGLRPEVWAPFRDALAVTRIIEFYASTEGNVNLFNNTGQVGAVGVVPFFAQSVYPIFLARTTDEAAAGGSGGGGGAPALVRDERGFCVPSPAGEPGQLLGLIRESDPTRRFDGYTDSEATGRKVVRNVRRAGDAYFASGDLLTRDWFGFYYWSDRAGDTFRWKGENVSTAEVGTVLAGARGVQDACVYGVLVPHCEGRAGMAAITVAGGAAALDPGVVYAHCAAHLPSYAQPVFLRVAQAGGTIEVTSTFKHKKANLQREGFDPVWVGGDALFVRDDARRTFVVLTPQHLADIRTGAVRV